MTHRDTAHRAQHIMRYASLLLFCAFLSACALQPKVELSFEQQLKLLQNEMRFGTAQRSLERAELDTQSKEILLAENQAMASEYETKVINTANQLQRKNAWQDAGDTYKQALGVFPESERLNASNSRFLVARDDYRRKALLQHRILRAKRIPAELSNLEAITDAGGDKDFKTMKLALSEEAERTAEALLSEGQRLLAAKRWKNAKTVLDLSLALKPDERTATALRIAKTNIKPPRKRKPRAVAKKEQPTPEIKVDESAVSAAMHRYRYALKTKNLVTARTQIELARQLKPEDETLKREQTQFLSLLASDAKQNIEQGKYYYSLGDIETAIKHWEQAYALTPTDDALRERLQKARRFRDRYEQLKR